MIYKFTITIYLLSLAEVILSSDYDVYFLKQCHRHDPDLNSCLQASANYLVEHFRHGIPELGYTEPEPIVIDEIAISLGNGGPDGYKASFTNIRAYGVSNVTITDVGSRIDTYEFKFTLHIPKISAKANYQSSGRLLFVPASGGGNYWGEYGDVKCNVYIQAAPYMRDGQKFVTLRKIKMDFKVNDIRMGVTNIHNGNSVLEAALNLFINSNAQALLKEMKPDLKKKLMVLMQNFINNLFENIPYDSWIV